MTDKRTHDERIRAGRIRAGRARAGRHRGDRRRKLILGGAAVAVATGVVTGSGAAARASADGAREVIPPGVAAGTPVKQATPRVVPNTTGIAGVVAYDTAGWPRTGHNRPDPRALSHDHVPGPVAYAVTPPVGGPHNPVWMNCGIYDKPVPAERAVHNLEHGAVWITYSPSLPRPDVSALRAFTERQTMLNPSGQGASRYMDLSPYPGLPSPIVVSSWGFQLRLASPSDPRLQRFVDKFRVSRTYSPESAAPCTGGVGTPLRTSLAGVASPRAVEPKTASSVSPYFAASAARADRSLRSSSSVMYYSGIFE